MNISLTPELEKAIRDQVETGLYSNASEVVREALRDWLARKAARERLIAALDEGIASADRGETVELTRELWDKLMAEGDALAAKGAPIDPLISGEL